MRSVSRCSLELPSTTVLTSKLISWNLTKTTGASQRFKSLTLRWKSPRVRRELRWSQNTAREQSQKCWRISPSLLIWLKSLYFGVWFNSTSSWRTFWWSTYQEAYSLTWQYQPFQRWWASSQLFACSRISRTSAIFWCYSRPSQHLEQCFSSWI